MNTRLLQKHPDVSQLILHQFSYLQSVFCQQCEYFNHCVSFAVLVVTFVKINANVCVIRTILTFLQHIYNVALFKLLDSSEHVGDLLIQHVIYPTNVHSAAYVTSQFSVCIWTCSSGRHLAELSFFLLVALKDTKVWCVISLWGHCTRTKGRHKKSSFCTSFLCSKTSLDI